MSKSNLKKIIYSLHPLERKVLVHASLEEVKSIAQISELSEAEVTTGLQLLEQRGFVESKSFSDVFVGLDKFGQKYLASDLPEIKLLKEVISKEKKMSQLKLDKSEIGSALGILKRNNLIEIRKEDEQIFKATKDAKKYLDSYKNPLVLFEKDVLKSNLDSNQKKLVEEFSRRPGFLKEISKKSFTYDVSKEGKELIEEIKKNYSNLDLIENLDSNMMKTGNWKDKEFRHYDIKLEANHDSVGRRHPMIEANNILRDVFIEMGFMEMTGPMVESAFWNMDIMWIPQDHPARDDQDTFYLDGECEVPKDLVKKVKDMHEKGIKETHTEENEWSEDITKRRLLRTHSTATTYRILAELGEKLKKGEDINGKYFYVANDFRNETVDATHLAEFFQADGCIVGDDLSLADLMGFVKEYYAKLGLHKIRFKPTYNPYTEPSMEAHYYDPKLKKWYALINSGIFRAETLEPLGLGKKTILAWGMGASRLATLLSGKDSMRDITGATCDFDWLKNRKVMKREVVR